MPHIKIESSAQIKNPQELLTKLHNLLPEVGPFNISDIKSRIHYADHYRVAEGADEFIHCEIKILPGRNLEIKKNLTEQVLKLLCEECKTPAVKTSFSVEICEIEKESYSKISL